MTISFFIQWASIAALWIVTILFIIRNHRQNKEINKIIQLKIRYEELLDEMEKNKK